MWVVGTATFQPDIPWDTIAMVLGLIVLTILLVAVLVVALLRQVAVAVERRREARDPERTP